MAIVVVVGGAFFIRLMNGPVSLDFMRDRIQALEKERLRLG